MLQIALDAALPMIQYQNGLVCEFGVGSGRSIRKFFDINSHKKTFTHTKNVLLILVIYITTITIIANNRYDSRNAPTRYPHSRI